MKPSAKYMVPLLVILFILLVPLPIAGAVLTSLYSDLHITSVFKLFELYHIAIIAAICSGLLAYSYARGYIGSHRSIYSAYGILLLLVTFFDNNPLSPLYGLFLTLAAIASMDALFLFAVRERLSRISFLSITLPLVIVAFFLPPYYMAISGLVIFSCALFVRAGTRGISILDVNMGAAGLSGGSAAKGAAPPAASPAANLPAAPGNTVQQKPQVNRKGVSRRGTKAADRQRRLFSGGTQGVSPPALKGMDAIPANVPWPGQSDYARAMQNLGFSISPDYSALKSSRVVPNPYIRLPGNVAYSSGNYGIIFRLENNGTDLAVKCFTRSKPDLNARYSAISKALSPLSGRGLAFVNFQYLPKAIRTFRNPSMYFPVLRMDWVEGKNLNTFISEQLHNRDSLGALASTFIDKMVQIRRAGIAHGDISGDNIVIGPSGTFTLVDYDGMYVPEFAGTRSPELGHDNFQHPRRTQNDYSERLDNFSILVTYLSLLSLAENPSLWTRYNKGDQDCLIFRKTDFVDTSRSGVIAELLKMKGRVGQLAELLCDALKHDPLWDGCDPQRIAKI
jgi:hypothetical protein